MRAENEGVFTVGWINRTRVRRVIAGAVAAAVLSVGFSGAAQAKEPGAYQRHVPKQEISVQLFNFFTYIGTDSTPEAQARQEEVLKTLSSYGYKNVEPVDYTKFQGLSAKQYKKLLDKYKLRAASMHTSVSMETTATQWRSAVSTAKTIGAKYIGAGADPRDFTTAEQWIAFAKKIDHFGAIARQQGLTYMVHSHDWEFKKVGKTTGYDLLQKYTKAKNVVFELDLYWATKAGVKPITLLRKYGERIKLLHVKDMAADGSITTVGKGIIDFRPIFAAAGKGIKFYVIERDPPFDGSAYDPFKPTAQGLAYLQRVKY